MNREAVLRIASELEGYKDRSLTRIASKLRSAVAAAPEPVAWIPFSERWPNRSPALDDPKVTTCDRVLVTNNLNSRDRMGRMSHVWLLAPIQSDNGEVVGFTDCDRKVHGLTHWKDPQF